MMNKQEFDARFDKRFSMYKGLPYAKAVVESLLAEAWEELNSVLVEDGLQPVLMSEFRSVMPEE